MEHSQYFLQYIGFTFCSLGNISHLMCYVYQAKENIGRGLTVKKRPVVRFCLGDLKKFMTYMMSTPSDKWITVCCILMSCSVLFYFFHLFKFFAYDYVAPYGHALGYTLIFHRHET